MISIQRQKGAEIVEFALVLPLLLLILFGIMEFGIVFFDKAIITNASREGARAGVVSRSPVLSNDDITTIVNNYSVGLVSFSSSVASPVVTVTTTTIAAEQFLTVKVEYSYTFLVLGNLMSLFIPSFSNPIVLSASTVMRYE
jgi:Flp pilus assembly protein TadG